MTKDDVIALARKARMRKYQHNLASNPVQIRISFDGDEAALLRFAAMVEQRAAAAEREACAKIADAEISKYPPGAPFNQYQSGIFSAAEHIAEAIRARGNHDQG